MHVRITTVTGASHIDEGVAFLRDEVVPQVKQQNGFRGFSVSADREAGAVSVLSVWDTEADLDASESTADKARQEAASVFGGRLAAVEKFEQLVNEIGPNPPGPGSKLQIRRIKMDPAVIDDNVEFFKSTVVPDMMAQPGFQAVRNLINRATGEGVVGTLWADDKALQDALARADERRAVAATRGVEFGESAIREVLFAVM